MNAIEFFYSEDDIIINRIAYWYIVIYLSTQLFYMTEGPKLKFTSNINDGTRFNTESDAINYYLNSVRNMSNVYKCYVEEHICY